MARTKSSDGLILVLSLLLIGVLLWQGYRSFHFGYLKGPYISLLDELKEEYVKESPLRFPSEYVVHERLDNGWRCLSGLANGVMLWQTYCDWSIDGSRYAPVLYQEKNRLEYQETLLPEGTSADRWSWKDNQILLATKKDPGSLDFSLDYFPAPHFEPRPRRIQVSVKEAVSVLPGLRICPLTSPIGMSPMGMKAQDVTVYRNGVPFPFEPRLLDMLMDATATIEPARSGEDQSPRGWAYLPGFGYQIYKARGPKEIDLFRTGDSYRERRFFHQGLVKIRIKARGDLAGPDLPVLAVSLDREHVGEIVIDSPVHRFYDLTRFIPAGWHEVRLKFTNDYLGRPGLAGSDRNIHIGEIGVQHMDGILIADDPSPASYSVADTYAEAPDIRWTRPFIFDAGIGQDQRQAVFAKPNTVISYPLVVPPESLLALGIGSVPTKKGRGENGCEVLVRLKPGSGAEQTILKAACPKPGAAWQDHRVDLRRFAGQKVLLTLEARNEDAQASESPLVVLGHPFISSQRQKHRQPSIFIVVADALRADHLGAYGYERATSPHLDAFAGDAVLFERAISQAPWTLAAVASLFTSLYPSFHGANRQDAALASSQTTLAEELEKQGYLTANFSQNGFLGIQRGFTQGFDWYRNDDLDIGTEARLQTALERLDVMRYQKVLLFLHILEPHSPYTPPREYRVAPDVRPQADVDTSTERLQEITSKGIVLPEREIRRFLELYDGEVRYFDALFEEFVAALKRRGLYEDSLIIVTSDHGEEFQEHGRVMHTQSVYQEVVHVPLMIKFPSRMGLRGFKIPHPVQLVDIPPTIYGLCGIKTTALVQGRSLLPLVLGNRHAAAAFRNRLVVTELMNFKIGLLRGPQKYISTRRNGVEELYDLEADPREKVNLAQALPDVLARFRRDRHEYEAAVKYYLSKTGGQAEGIALDQKDIETLRALGYIR